MIYITLLIIGNLIGIALSYFFMKRGPKGMTGTPGPPGIKGDRGEPYYIEV